MSITLIVGVVVLALIVWYVWNVSKSTEHFRSRSRRSPPPPPPRVDCSPYKARSTCNGNNKCKWSKNKCVKK